MPRPSQWVVCSFAACPELVQGSTRCPDHTVKQPDTRPSGTARGWNKTWATFRTDYLRRHPLCNCDDCLLIPFADRPAATDIDHQAGHSRICAHAYDETVLVAMSHSHHSRKTGREDGRHTAHLTPRCPPLPQETPVPRRRGGGTLTLAPPGPE